MTPVNQPQHTHTEFTRLVPPSAVAYWDAARRSVSVRPVWVAAGTRRLKRGRRWQDRSLQAQWSCGRANPGAATRRHDARARRSDQSQRGVRHLDAVAGEFAPATRPQTRTSRSMRRSPLPHPQGATLRHPFTDRVGVPRRRNDRTSRCLLLRRGPDHRTHHPPLASTDVRRSPRLAADARGGNSSRRGSSQAQLEPTKDTPGCAGPPHPRRGGAAPRPLPRVARLAAARSPKTCRPRREERSLRAAHAAVVYRARRSNHHASTTPTSTTSNALAGRRPRPARCRPAPADRSGEASLLPSNGAPSTTLPALRRRSLIPVPADSARRPAPGRGVVVRSSPPHHTLPPRGHRRSGGCGGQGASA